MINERKNQEVTHKKFTSKYGGKVFYIISIADEKKKVIHNREIIGEIQQEIERLQAQ